MTTKRKPFRGAWWGRETGSREPHMVPPGATGDTAGWRAQPALLRSGRTELAADVRDRRETFTPDWRPAKAGDAGDAVITLFGEQAEPIVDAVNRLPEKLFVELLRCAGVAPAPATPAATLLQFTIAEGATESVLIPAGFQVGARPADGGRELVVFETEQAIDATSATITELCVQQGALVHPVKVSAETPVQPFGRAPKTGNALWIGLAGDTPPTRSIAIGFELLEPEGDPTPVPAGGVTPLPTGPIPLLAWDVLDGGSFVRVEVIEDQTANLTRSGIVVLRLPQTWKQGRPDIIEGTAQLRWLRLQLVVGMFPRVPALSTLRINVARATAARTIFDEVIEPVAGSGGRRFRLSQVPVLPNTVQLLVDEGGPTPMLWQEVDDLAQHGPDDRVFTLDPASGEIATGNNEQGAAVPPGFRNVVAASYRVGGGAGGSVAAGAVNILLRSAAFVLGAQNPLPATGGTPGESRSQTLRRGPQEIRARGRAVTLADYELLALRATGAKVARAHAVSGFYPGLAGRPLPGVVGLLIVPADKQGRPVPDEEELRAVATYMTTQVAPAGVTVVAGAVHYHSIRFEARIVFDPTVNEGMAIDETLRSLDRYVHPLTGGDDGSGWPFGGGLRYASVVRRLLTDVRVNNRVAILAVPRLSFVVDGIRVKACEDALLPPHDLFWPARHDIIPVPPGGS